MPNLLSTDLREALHGWLPDKQITLSLDLCGGSHLVPEVDRNVLVQERLQAFADDARAELREVGIAGAEVEVAGNAVAVTLSDPERRSEVTRLLRGLSNPQTLLPVYGGEPVVEIGTPSGTEVRLTLTESGLRDRVHTAVEQSLEIDRWS